MADHFREMFEGLKQTAEAQIEAHEALARASAALARATAGIKRTVEAALAAKNEHEDLRETVHRLEGLVMEQGAQLRALREELHKRNGQGG